MALKATNARIAVSTDDVTYTEVDEMKVAGGTFSPALLDANKFGADYNKRIAGLKDFTVSLSGGYRIGDTNGQAAIRAALLNDSALYVKFLPDATNGFKAAVRVNSWQVSATPQALQDLAIELVCSGASVTVGAMASMTASATSIGTLKGLNALVKISGTPTAMTAEATTSSGPNTTYQITNAAKRVLSPTATITVKDGGVATVESYTLNRLTGTVVFGSAVVRTITIDGTYLPMATLGESNNLSYTISANNVDTTKFLDEYTRRKQGLKDFQASVGGFYIDSTYLNLLIAGNPQIFEVYSDGGTTPDLRAWCLMGQDAIEAAVEGMVSDGLEFSGTADANNRTVAVSGF